MVFFAYTGFEAVANMGEETRKPARDLPLGLLGTLGLCTVLYIGVSFVLTGMVSYTKISEGAPIANAFEQVGLSWAAKLVSIAAICGLTSVILVDILAMGRIGFAMGRDNLLPPAVAKIHPKWGTPYRITGATIVLVAVLAGLVPLSALADLVSIGTLFAFIVVSIAVPVLRRTKPDMKRPFRVPLSPVIPILSALACLYLMTNLSVETWVRFLIWMVLGLAVYFFYGKRNARLARPAEERPPPARSERALPDTAGPLPGEGTGPCWCGDGSGSEVAAALLLALDGLEQGLEVALAEAERAVPLDQLEEHGRAVPDRPGEDLQQIAVLVAVDEDAALLQLLDRHPHVADPARSSGSA